MVVVVVVVCVCVCVGGGVVGECWGFVTFKRSLY